MNRLADFIIGFLFGISVSCILIAPKVEELENSYEKRISILTDANDNQWNYELRRAQKELDEIDSLIKEALKQNQNEDK